MSTIATAVLNLALSIASARNSGLSIRIRKNGEVKLSFVGKNSQSGVVWENHYKNVAFYLGEAANPVRWDFDVENYNGERVVDAIDNAISTKYYQTFMKQEALTRIFNISGPQQDTIIKLLYGILGGIVILAMLLLAIYGGA